MLSSPMSGSWRFESRVAGGLTETGPSEVLLRACCRIPIRLASLCDDAVPRVVKRKDEKRASENGALSAPCSTIRSRSAWNFGMVIRQSFFHSVKYVVHRQTQKFRSSKVERNLAEVRLIQQKDDLRRKDEQ